MGQVEARRDSFRGRDSGVIRSGPSAAGRRLCAATMRLLSRYHLDLGTRARWNLSVRPSYLEPVEAVMLALALRAACTSCSWRGWIRIEPNTVGGEETYNQSILFSLPYYMLNCPKCGCSSGVVDTGINYESEYCSPKFYCDSPNDLFDGIVPDPEPELEPERVVSYLYDIWCPHCSCVETISMLRPNSGWHETKCVKCSRSYQVNLVGNGRSA